MKCTVYCQEDFVRVPFYHSVTFSCFGKFTVSAEAVNY